VQPIRTEPQHPEETTTGVAGATECGAGAAGGVTSAPADIAVSITMLYMSCNLSTVKTGEGGDSPSVLTMVDLKQISVKGKQRNLGRMDR
jgi:hypothetical protein